MNRKDFITRMLSAIPALAMVPEFKEEKADGFGWMTDPVKLSMRQRKKWKDRIEKELKDLFFSVEVRVNVIATYLENEGRFHVTISREAYVRDLYSTRGPYEGYNPYA